MTYAPYLIAAIVPLALAHLGVTQSLGAHPFWATQVAWIGVPIGLVSALALHRIGKLKRIVLFAVVLVTAAAAAHFGKQRFAASFAEDQLAGQFWHFGWIGVAAASAALISALLTQKT